MVVQLSMAAVLIGAVALLGSGVLEGDGPRAVPDPPEEPGAPRATQPAASPEAAPQPGPGADVEVEVALVPEAYEFGFLRPTEAVTRTLTLTNLESTPIRLNGVARGCTCTKLQVRPQVLKPGQSIEVPATLTAGLTPTSKDSSMKLEVVGRPPIVLPVKGEIIRGVRARPRDIDTYRYRGAEGNYIPRGRILLDAPEGPAFRILSVNGEPRETALAARHAVDWDVSAYDPVTGLNARGEMIPRVWLVETDHPETPVMEVMVRHRAHRVTPVKDRPWFFIEQRVNVGGIPQGGVGSFTLPVKWQGGKPKPASITGARSESTAFTASLVGHTQEGRESNATVQITPAAGVEGPFEGLVTLVGTDHEWAIPVVGHAARTTP